MISPAKVKKTIVVIGGGPAGLEAARVAAKKGHSVTLFENTIKLGGQLNIANVPPRKSEIDRAVEDLAHAIHCEGVTLRMGEMATTQSVLALAPDAVIVAVGASNFIPAIQGVDGFNVRNAWKVLAGEQAVSGRVVVVGGGMVGCETAEYLAEQGCQVSVVEMSDKIASEVGMTVLPTMLEFFKDHAIAQFTGHKVINIRADEVICENQDGQTVKIPCDYVVMASGARSVKFDTAQLTDKGISVVEIGDCRQVANISHAIKTGYEAANAL